MLDLYYTNFVPFDRTIEIFFSGCIFRCRGCHNKKLLQRAKNYVSVQDIIKQIEPYKNIHKMVHILGGEPFIQDFNSLCLLIKELKKNGYQNVIIFTGFEHINALKKYLKNKFGSLDELFKLTECDYIKFGKYKNGLQPVIFNINDNIKIKLASDNQFIISKEKENEFTTNFNEYCS